MDCESCKWVLFYDSEEMASDGEYYDVERIKCCRPKGTKCSEVQEEYK